jgi:hypothetical protein
MVWVSAAWVLWYGRIFKDGSGRCRKSDHGPKGHASLPEEISQDVLMGKVSSGGLARCRFQLVGILLPDFGKHATRKNLRVQARVPSRQLSPDQLISLSAGPCNFSVVLLSGIGIPWAKAPMVHSSG